MNTLAALFIAVSMANPFNQSVTDYVSQYSNVIETYCVEYGETAVIAVRTEPFYTRSEAKKFKDGLADAVKYTYGYKTVIVNTDSDVFYLAKKAAGVGLDDEELQQLADKAFSRV